MKKTTTKATRRGYKITDAIPLFVSIVERGANLIPWSNIKYAEEGKYSEVSISRVVFTKDKFSSEDDVRAYLDNNDFVDYEVSDTGETFTVYNADSEQFTQVDEIKADPGVSYFVGKLKEPTEETQPAAEVIEQFSETGQSVEEAIQEAATEVVEAVEAEVIVPEVVEEEFSETVATEEVQIETIEEVVETPTEAFEEEAKAELVEETGKVEVYDEEGNLRAEFGNLEGEKVTDAVEAAPEVPELEARSEGKFAQFTSQKYSSDYSSFRETIDDFIKRGLPISFDTIMWVFGDTVISSLYNDDFDQLKKNTTDLYSFFVSYTSSIKNLSFSEETVEEPVIETVTEENNEQTVESFQEPIDTVEELVQNTSNITLTDTNIETKQFKSPTVQKFEQRELNNLLGNI